MKRTGSDVWAGLTGLITGMVLVWAWALTTPAWTTTITAESASESVALGSPDLGILLTPIALFLGGLVAGTIGWSLVERRAPAWPRFQPQPMSRAIPAAIASGSMLLLATATRESWAAWSQEKVIQEMSESALRIEITTSYTPSAVATALTVGLAWWLTVYAAAWLVLWVRGEPEQGSDPVVDHDGPWEPGRRLATMRPEERPLFRDEPNSPG